VPVARYWLVAGWSLVVAVVVVVVAVAVGCCCSSVKSLLLFSVLAHSSQDQAITW
jgi:hypothetical protein